MFNWFQSKISKPPLSETNPGKGVEFRVALSNSERTWEEKVNLVDCLSKVLKSHNHTYKKHDRFVELDSGFILQPQIVALHPLENGDVRTVSTIEVSHSELIPQGVFEYQHATGNDSIDAFIDGFHAWVMSDLVVFLDAAHQTLTHCTSLQMEFPQTKPGKARHRRVVLGPVAHLITEKIGQEQEDHPFCPCCLLTNTFEAFRQFLEGDEFYGIRFFAMRNNDGAIEADCRVNGEDWEPGKQALITYGETWPNRGFEFRKQYLIIQSWDILNE